MAKDPAFLFYPGDWMGGTMTLSRLQKGCYIDILIAQFNNGPLSLEKIRTVLGQDQANWTVLSSKFKQDSNGLFYNERLATEIEKRKKFVGRMSENGQKGGRPKNLQQNLQDNLQLKPHESNNEDENKNEIEIKNSFGKSENLLSDLVLEAAEMNQFTHTGLRNTEFIKSQWETFLKERKNDPPFKQRQNKGRLGEYFLNWNRNKFPKKVNGNKVSTEDIKKRLDEIGDQKV